MSQIELVPEGALNVFNLPTLFSKNSKGKLLEWDIVVYELNSEKNFPIIKIQFGQVNGKIQTQYREIKSGKNLNKANKTNAYEQAVSEAKSKWAKKKETCVTNKNHLNNDEGESIGYKFRPMLAHDFHKRGKDIKFPCFVEQKLDGVRCNIKLALNNSVKYVSRTGKEFFNLQHLDSQVINFMKKLAKNVNVNTEDLILDTELYCHPETNIDSTKSLITAPQDTDKLIRTELEPLPKLLTFGFNDIVSCIKKKAGSKNVNLDKIKYIQCYVFDYYNDYKNDDLICDDLVCDDHEFKLPKKIFHDQVKRKEALSLTFSEYIKTCHDQLLVEVKPLMVYDRNELSNIHDEFVNTHKCEGIIIRQLVGVYEPGKRSVFLQKYKKFIDSEYKIIDFTQADGRDIGTVVWICEYTNKDNKISNFNVRPMGSLEERKDFFENGKDYIGKMLTVKYQELTDELCPRFPVGKGIRDYE
jgi:hypothetical protein